MHATLAPARLPPFLQCEMHELAGGHGPEFVLEDHLPQAPAVPQASGQQAGGQGAAPAAAAAGGPVPMAE